MTEITKTTPAVNPADVNTLDGLNNMMQDKIFLNLEKVLPGIVQSYDRTTNRASIKPAITGVASKGQKVSRGVLNNIPVVCLSGGGVTMSFPLKAGDTGWLIACDRNISIFKQNLEESAPNDYRKHNFMDSFFLPDKINNSGITDPNSFVIKAGSKAFTISESEVNVTDIKVGNGASGTFVSQDNKTVTVTNGIVTSIS